MKINFEVHESHIPLWENSNWRYAVICGGRGNGRSGTASRFAISKLLGKEYTRGAIMRATREDIRASCWGEIMDRINEQKITDSFRIVDNDMFIEKGQNSLRAHGFRASSGSLTARLKSLAGYNFIWIEEAEEIGEDEFRTLDDTLRTVKGSIRIILTLNTPPKNHWIIKKWFDLDPSQDAEGFYVPKLKTDTKDVIYIGGSWKENQPNMDANTIERYEAYKHTNPSYYWQVIRGLSPDEVRGKIYTGWQQIDNIPQGARLVRFGEDFGWFPDPAAVVAVWYWNGSYILDEVCYGTELSNEFTAGEIKKYGSAITIADSAEPKSIAEQRKYGIVVQGTEKGKDSVNFIIKVVSQKKILVTRRSKNVWESYENFRWAEDKDGNPKGEPERRWKHCFAPETLIYTTIGRKRIDELVGKEGYLYTRDGRIERFFDVQKTRENTEVVSLIFEDGNILTVTPDHLLLLENNQWIEASLLSPTDRIQSSMYEGTSIQWGSISSVLWREILQWTKKTITQSSLGILQWSNSQRNAYSSQRQQFREQFDRKSTTERSPFTPFKAYDKGTSKMGEQERGGQCNANGEEMAWVKRREEISLVSWKEKLGEQKTFFQKMRTLPQRIQNTYESFKRQILWKKLCDESKAKTIKRIEGGFRAVTYNLEVENTHCLIADGVIAHNSMDAAGYAIASMHNKVMDIVRPQPPRQKRNVAI